MNEKDAIKDLFSNAFEQHSASVRPEVWQGLQAKMAAAGVAGTSAAAAKGISALTKWIIGGAAVVGTATVAAVLLLGEKPQNSQADKTGVAKNVNAVAVSMPAPEVKAKKHENIPSLVPSTSVNEESAVSQTNDSELSGILAENNPSVVKPSGKTMVNPEPAQGEISPNPAVKPANPPVNPPTPEQSESTGVPGGTSVQPVAKITRIPNVLTPNHDGDNDEFFIESENITDFSVVFLNSAGQQVYKSADPAFHWDGTDLNGEPVPNGQYRCVIIASGSDKKPIKRLEMVVVAR